MLRRHFIINTNSSIPDNEIWYTTVDESIVETTAPIDSEWGMMFGTKMVSNTYENGIGIMKFEDDLTFIGPFTFSGNQKLKTIILPSKITRIITMDSPFYGCTSLISIVLPDNLEYIGDMVFYNCSSLSSITIPNSVTSIGSGVFSGCNSLTSITIPNSVTSIGESAFTQCGNLTSIAIPNSVMSIGDYAFSYCSGLTSITYTGTASQWNTISKGYNWNDNVIATVVHCTDGDVEI